MHDNYQNCLNDSITNAQFDFSVEDGDEENSQMMCCDIIADTKNNCHQISAQAYEEHNQIIQNDDFKSRNRCRLKSQNSNISFENATTNEP
jgi:regulator of RNase E activity RraB